MDDDDLKSPSIDDAYKAWKARPSPEANASMLQTLDPVIEGAAKTHVGSANPLIKGRARRMTLDALKTYDPARGPLPSHIYNHLRGLKRYSAQTSAPINVPERIMLDRRTMKLAQGEMADELGRDPTDDELADKLGMSLKRIHHVRTYSPPMSEGFFSQMGESGEGFAPAVKSPATGSWLQMVYGDLPPTDQKIMEWSLGMNGQRQISNQEIASKLRVSPGLVSQRKKLIQQTLNQEQELSPFGA